jgi:hypothetical protein
VQPIDILQEKLKYVRQFGHPDDGGLTEYHAFCPVHDRVQFEPGRAPAPPDRPLRIYVDHIGSVERLECDHGCSQRDVLAKLPLRMTDLIGSPWANDPPAVHNAKDGAPPQHQQQQQQSLARFGYEPVMTRLSDITPEPLRWLWPGRIPLGKLTVISGDPGLGKTFLAHDIAARVSAGRPWPGIDQPEPVQISRKLDARGGGSAADGTGASDVQIPRKLDGCSRRIAPGEAGVSREAGVAGEAGDVILLSAEDGLADTIYPRLAAAGADLTRVRAITAVRGVDGFESQFSLARDLASLDMALDQCQQPRLVVIDPISAYLSHTDSHNNAEVRG